VAGSEEDGQTQFRWEKIEKPQIDISGNPKCLKIQQRIVVKCPEGQRLYGQSQEE